VIDTAFRVAEGLIKLARKQVDPCREAKAARELAKQALTSFAATGGRKYHRAYIRHKRMARWWAARCAARS